MVQVVYRDVCGGGRGGGVGGLRGGGGDLTVIIASF